MFWWFLFNAQLVLVIGDLHIPYRAHDIPAEFKSMFVSVAYVPSNLQQSGRFEYVILTGNLCSRDVFDYFRSFTSFVYAVAGEYDDVRQASYRVDIDRPRNILKLKLSR